MALQIIIDGFDPDAEQWQNANPEERRHYYRLVAEEAEKALTARFRAGRDRFGAPLLPVLHPNRRPGNGPPLIPRRGQSRSITLMRSKAEVDRCIIYWDDNWGDILEYHRRGIPSRLGLRVRDIGGFTPEEFGEIKTEATKRWRATTTAPLNARVINQPRRRPLQFGNFFESPY